MLTPRLTACRGYCAAGLPGQARSSAGPRPREEAMNWLAIVVATVVNMVLGALWFSPMLFQKPWMAMRVDKAPMSGTASPMLYVITAVGALVGAITTDWIIGLAGASTLVGGALIGVSAGLGFVAPAILSDNLFNERPFKLYLIVAGFPVVGLFVMGAIIGALGA
ncbi:MAG TPA: hypothetical protein DCK98_15105 [Chloroflexi bacterium]|nr:hypothetical protein [Chloroflexota bacterium]HAL28963.1 hypothetical protein [Chloroflexota bacterium]